jgi:hypothetical protein
MSQNISKYIQLTDFLLIEYEFNRDGIEDTIYDGKVVNTTSGFKQYYDKSSSALGETNNILELNSVATDPRRSGWFNNHTDISQFNDYFDSSLNVGATTYAHDTVKVHIISGYNFDDIAGFLLQVRAEDSSLNLVDLINFTYIKQDEIRTGGVTKFSANALFLGSKLYDKYVEFKIPSVYALGNDTFGGFDSSLGQFLNVKPLSDVHITYSTVPTIQSSATTDNVYSLVEEVDLQLPVTSTADRFNSFIAQSTEGDYIEFYATFDEQIIGQYMGDIESGRIALYTSNNPNDNYDSFSETYGTDAAKWVLIHELFVYEHFGSSSILTQKFSFTQENNFSQANYFRPVLQNADIDSSFTIQYICRLTNRMDGSQIIRRSAFSSTDPKKYGLRFTRINVNNIIPYKVFNRIDQTQPNIMQTGLKPQTKFVKVFYDTTEVLMNQKNEVYPQGIGPLMLRKSDSVYKFKFEKYNEESDERENVDLSGAYNYGLLFVLDDESKLEVGPTYSMNMNTTVGELEFKLSESQVERLLKQKDKTYAIIIKNPDGTSYNFYEGQYYSYQKRETQRSEIETYINKITELNKKITKLESSNKKIQEEYNELLAENQEAAEEEVQEESNEQTGLVTRRREPRQTRLPSTKISKPTVTEQELAEKVEELELENKRLSSEIIKVDTQRTPSAQYPSQRVNKSRPTEPLQ